MNNPTHTIDQSSIDAIREALVIGLTSFGEIDRLTEETKLLQAIGKPVPEQMLPMHPTACIGTVSTFSAAFMELEALEHRFCRQAT